MSSQVELRSGALSLGLEVDAVQSKQLLNYLVLLNKWNKVFNLTAIQRQDDMVRYHLLDSLAVIPHLWPSRWLDVGCGAGLPGLVMAIMKPQWEITMLDSNSKKTGFVQQVAIELGLDNVRVCCTRVEEFNDAVLFDGIISRAFANLDQFLRLTRHLLAEKGKWAAMKGRLESELETLPASCKVDKIIRLKVPGIEAVRSLVVVSSNGA